MNKLLVLTGVILVVLHQDFWNWDRADLVFGLLPVGLAYHVAYTVAVALFWVAVVAFAWPREPDSSTGGGEASGGRDSAPR